MARPSKSSPRAAGSYEQFGAALRMLRTESGVGLRALAREIGVSSAYLSRVETGRDPPPTPDRLAAIAQALDIPAATLVEVAGRTGAAVTAYVDRVPTAGALFLEIARRDLDATAIERLARFVREDLARAPVPAPPARSLAALIPASRVRLHLATDRLDEIIHVGATLCARGAAAGSAASIAALLRTREADCPTALGHGVAVPHARIDGVRQRAALITPARPIASATPDGAPVCAVFVLLSGTREEHANALALVARLASHGAAQQLWRASTTRAARSVLRDR